MAKNYEAFQPVAIRTKARKPLPIEETGVYYSLEDCIAVLELAGVKVLNVLRDDLQSHSSGRILTKRPGLYLGRETFARILETRGIFSDVKKYCQEQSQN